MPAAKFSLDELKTRMAKSVSTLKDELSGLRTGRGDALLGNVDSIGLADTAGFGGRQGLATCRLGLVEYASYSALFTGHESPLVRTPSGPQLTLTVD